MAKKGRNVALVAFTLPIKTTIEIRAITALSRRRMADIGRDFFAECWPDFLARHPDLKAMAEAGMPKIENSKVESFDESPASAEAERSEGEMAATA